MSPTAGCRTLACFVLFAAVHASASAVEIRLRTRAESAGPLVRLADVAELSDADQTRVQELGRLPLFPAPSRGRTRSITREELGQLLLLHAVKLRDLQFTGADSVLVQAPGAARPAAAQRLPVRPAVSLEPAAAPVATEAASVVVAVRPLRTGDVIQASDLELKPETDGQRSLRAATAVEPLIGQELKRPISAGQVLEADQVQAPRLVRRGEAVTLRSIAAGVTITTTGKSLGEGAHGELVEVLPAEGREKLLARVVGPQAVEVYALVNRASRLTEAAAR